MAWISMRQRPYLAIRWREPFPTSITLLGSFVSLLSACRVSEDYWWSRTLRPPRKSESLAPDLPRPMRGKDMNPEEHNDDLRPEYDFDFSRSVRGKYYHQYLESTNVIVLDPDVAAAFQNSAAVNEALRAMLRFAEQTSSLTGHSSRPADAGG